MNEPNRIKAAFERIVKTYIRRPAIARDTLHSTCRLGNDLSCEIKEGNWSINAGMPVEVGGNGQAPSPGVLGRAALGSCIAIGFKLWAAKLDVPVSALEVTIEADSDDAGLFGTAEVDPGYSAIRYNLRIESDAAEADIMNLVRKCEAHSPWLDNFKRAVECSANVEIIR